MSDRQFEVLARIVFRTTVTIDADSPEEARVKFNTCDWADDGLNGAEMTDYLTLGPFKVTNA